MKTIKLGGESRNVIEAPKLGAEAGIESRLLACDFLLLTSNSCLLTSDFCFENSRPYERTQHVIENKAQEFSEPSMSMKINSLTEETQHIFDKKILSLEFAG